MKLFYKIYIFLAIILIVMMVLYGDIVHKREVSLFNSDMKNDALLLGKAISGPIKQIWTHAGMDMALSFIDDVNLEEHQMKIKWVWLDNRSNGRYSPGMPLKMLDRVSNGESVSLTGDNPKGEPFRYTYVPVRVDQNQSGALEISESLKMMKQYSRDSIIHLFYIAIILVLGFGGILWWQFQIWIHHPLQRFIKKSVQIGKGDLSPDLFIKGHNEFSLMAATLNDMCKNLDATQKAIHIEHEKRLAALEQLRHTERIATLGRLSAGVAHELGTPLNIISGRAKMIREGNLGKPEVEENARIIHEQSQRMTQIIRSLLDFARRRQPNRQLEDMGMMVRNVVDMLDSTAGKAKVSLHFEQVELPRILIDSAQIQQVLINLIMNGIQAMPNGGSLFLNLSVVNTHHPDKNSADKKYLAVQIDDEGEGIAEENMPHVFEPFFTTKDVGQGSGLGLSIVYGIVEDHGGWVHAGNRPDGGARFTVYLPVETEG